MDFIYSTNSEAKRLMRHNSIAEFDKWSNIYTLRLKYREETRTTLSKAIIGKMNKETASETIQNEAGRLPEEENLRFIESVELEILSLHEGNFARYRIKPSEFKEWKLVWEKDG